MSPFEIAIRRSLEKLRDYEFNRPLNSLEGSLLHDWVATKFVGDNNLPIEQEIKNKIWCETIKNYEQAWSWNAKVMNIPIKLLVINPYKAELIRYYLRENKGLWDKITQ